MFSKICISVSLPANRAVLSVYLQLIKTWPLILPQITVPCRVSVNINFEYTLNSVREYIQLTPLLPSNGLNVFPLWRVPSDSNKDFRQLSKVHSYLFENVNKYRVRHVVQKAYTAWPIENSPARFTVLYVTKSSSRILLFSRDIHINLITVTSTT